MFSLVGIWEYIQDVRETVHDLEQRLQRTKDNVEEIQTIMKSWTTPVFERKEGKKDTLLNLDDKTERLERTYGQIRTSGTKIHLLLKVCNDKSQRWSHQMTEWRILKELLTQTFPLLIRIIFLFCFRTTCHSSKQTRLLRSGRFMWITLMKWSSMVSSTLPRAPSSSS